MVFLSQDVDICNRFAYIPLNPQRNKASFSFGLLVGESQIYHLGGPADDCYRIEGSFQGGMESHEDRLGARQGHGS